MNANESNQTNDEFVDRLVSAFEEQPLPPRPSNAETAVWISQNTKLDVPTKPQPLNRRKVMRIMAPLAAVAASFAFAASFWPANNNAFAQVVKQIENARTVTFSIAMKQPDKPELIGKASARRPHLLRIDWTFAGQTTVNITDYTRNELISFGESSAVTVHAIPDSGGFDVVRQLLNVDAQRTTSVPDSENDIPNTDLFEIEEGGLTGRLWSDEDTGLPVRIEMDVPNELGGGLNVFSDFVWDAEVDDSIFTIPANREIVRNTLMAEPTEEELIAGLRIWQAFSSGPYPEDFLGNQVGLVIGRLAYKDNLSRTENHERQLEVLGPILTSIGMTQIEARDPKALQQRIDYLCMKVDQWKHYVAKYGDWVGGGVRPGEDKPLCWWKLPSKRIRVLYADLTIRDAEVAPQR